MRLPALICSTLLSGLFVLSSCGSSEPEPELDVSQMQLWPHGGMVAAADPRAVQAGVAVLEAGGHAVDAAIAVHAMLGLVEPQSSGIGGGAFMIVYERDTGEITVFDGRETAPASVTPDHFIDENGEVRGYIDSWQSGLSVGVPGQVALYEAAHSQFGRAEFEHLLEPAAALAERGFKVSPRLAEVLANPRLRAATQLDKNETTAAYFYPNGEPLAAGELRTNQAYADTLRAIGQDGAKAFYTGPIAQSIVDAVAENPRPATMTLEDLENYKVIVREPVCGTAFNHRICSAPPPSSGGSTQNAILGLYERMVAQGDLTDDEKLIAFVDAQRLAYADRDHYVADADFVTVPTADLFDPTYLDARVQDRFPSDATPQPGDPGAVLRGEPIIDMWGRDQTDDRPGTTHISIIDQDGNAVSMTATIESAFGASRMASGFLLNNELTDFSRAPTKNGKAVANAPEAGKRPRSSMSPTLVFDADNNLFMVTGSPGGNSIIAYVSKTLVAALDWNMSAQETVDLPNVIARGQSVGVETTTDGGEAWGELLKAAGYDVRERSGENSGLHVIIVRDDGLEGGADKRREGVAIPVR